MKKQNYFALLIICILIPWVSIAQGVYPDIYSHFSNLSHSFNSAYLKDTNTFQLVLKHKSQNANLYKTALQAQYKLKEAQVAHWIGTYLDNKKDGPYLQSPKANLYYTLAVNLSSQFKLAASSSLGLSSLSANLPDQSYNYTLPDGAISLCLRNDHFSIGASGQQIFNNSIQGYRLSRYYTLFVAKTIDISPSFTLDLYVLHRIFVDLKDDIRFLGSINWQNQFKLGASINTYHGVYFFAEPSFYIENHKIGISIGYNTQYANRYRFLPNTTELGIIWYR